MEISLAVTENETPAEPRDAAGEPEPQPGRLGPGEGKGDEQLLRETAALLFAAPEPLTQARLIELLERPSAARVARVLERLALALDGSPLPIVLHRIAGGWRLSSDPEVSAAIARLRAEPRAERISAAALETLAIIAYRQPVTKAEVEAIRGVQAGPLLRALVDRGLVRVTGRADLPGSPLLYGTTGEFLERFGLGSLKDLPRDGELAED